MTDLSDVTQIDMKKLLELMEKTIDSNPGKKITVNRSGSVVKTAHISTVRTHNLHDDSFLTLVVDNV